MKIDSKDFRVTGKKVKLTEWPTIVKPFCKSKEEYQEVLQKHVDDSSKLQQLALLIKLPMSDGVVVGRVENGLFEKAIIHLAGSNFSVNSRIFKNTGYDSRIVTDAGRTIDSKRITASRDSDSHAQPDCVVRRVDQILLGAQIPFGRLNRSVAEQQLNLLQLAAGPAAQFRAGTTSFMGRCEEVRSPQHIAEASARRPSLPGARPWRRRRD